VKTAPIHQSMTGLFCCQTQFATFHITATGDGA
jgi:hypothetical protein